MIMKNLYRSGTLEFSHKRKIFKYFFLNKFGSCENSLYICIPFEKRLK